MIRCSALKSRQADCTCSNGYSADYYDFHRGIQKSTIRLQWCLFWIVCRLCFPRRAISFVVRRPFSFFLFFLPHDSPPHPTPTPNPAPLYFSFVHLHWLLEIFADKSFTRVSFISIHVDLPLTFSSFMAYFTTLFSESLARPIVPFELLVGLSREHLFQRSQKHSVLAITQSTIVCIHLINAFSMFTRVILNSCAQSAAALTLIRIVDVIWRDKISRKYPRLLSPRQC